MLGRVSSGLLSLMDGAVERAAEEALEVVQRSQELELRAPAYFAANLAQWPLLYLGRANELLELQEQQAEHLESKPEASALAARNLALAYAGQSDAALAGLRNSLLGLAPPDDDWTPARNLLELLATAICLEDVSAIEELAGRLGDLEAVGITGYVASVLRHRGDAYRLLAQAADSRGLYERALTSLGVIGFRPELALTHLGLAELLLDHYPDERDAAIEHLDFAIAELRDMKMQPALERALRHRGLLKA
jgi:tetratricopeptide (TPR) repeat protein